MSEMAIKRGTIEKRESILKNIPSIGLLNEKVRENVITAWITSISNSEFHDINLIPYSLLAKKYKLVDHVNEVVSIGLMLYDFALSTWKMNINKEILVQALILHDLDKPLMFVMKGDDVEGSAYYRAIPHGVLGAIILTKLGIDQRVIFAVANHPANSITKGNSPEEYILHYADFLSADHAILVENGTPFFKKRVL